MLSRETFSYLEPYSLSPHASFGVENLKKRRKNRQKAKRLLTTLSTGTTGMNAAVVRRVAVWPLRLPSAPVLRAPSLGDVSKLRPVACDLLLGFGEINVSSLHLRGQVVLDHILLPEVPLAQRAVGRAALGPNILDGNAIQVQQFAFGKVHVLQRGTSRWSWMRTDITAAAAPVEHPTSLEYC